jgi:hypothetical protein
MTFRVTTSLSRQSADGLDLDRQASGLLAALEPSAPQGHKRADVRVDPVKAAVQVTVLVEAEDALMAARTALDVVGQALLLAQLERPTSVITIEAEAVPTRVEHDPGLHPVPPPDPTDPVA